MKSIVSIFVASLILTACAAEQTKEKSTVTISNNQIIEISPDQKIFVEVVITDGQVIQLKPVEKIENPKRTLTLEFKPFDKGMLLQVNNPFDQAIKYNIDMIDRKGNAHQTSSCPVIPGGAAFENWPHPIPKLQIKNVRLLKNSKDLTCTY